jgi:uncharacterized protein
MSDDDTLALADRLLAAIEAGDLEAVSACYRDDFVSWSNIDDRAIDRAASLRLLGWLCAKLSDRRYEVRRRELIPGGYLQEHVLHGTAPDGSAVAMPACLVVTLAGPSISRIHEYLDPAGVAALSA